MELELGPNLRSTSPKTKTGDMFYCSSALGGVLPLVGRLVSHLVGLVCLAVSPDLADQQQTQSQRRLYQFRRALLVAL